MPLYEYKCHLCGKTFEVIQKFSDEPLKVHAECGGATERVLSAPAFHLKGSGWYATDYAKGSGTLPAKPSDSKSGAGESKSDSGSSDKPDSKSSGESKPDSSSTSSSSGDSKPAVTTSESK